MSAFNYAKVMALQPFEIINNDHQRALKGSKWLQGEEERMIIVPNTKAVDQATLKVDDHRTVCATLENIANEYTDNLELAFTNDYDQNNDSIPRCLFCEKKGIAHVDGLGDIIQSSSWLLK